MLLLSCKMRIDCETKLAPLVFLSSLTSQVGFQQVISIWHFKRGRPVRITSLHWFCFRLLSICLFHGTVHAKCISPGCRSIEVSRLVSVSWVSRTRWPNLLKPTVPKVGVSSCFVSGSVRFNSVTAEKYAVEGMESKVRYEHIEKVIVGAVWLRNL